MRTGSIGAIASCAGFFSAAMGAGDEKTLDSYPCWSPAGTQIIFAAGARNLTNHPAVDVMPSWSPDGCSVALFSNRDGGFNLYLVTDSGEEVRPLIEEPPGGP